jgi:hypothetical protein
MTTESSKPNPLEIEPENPEAASTLLQSEERAPELEQPAPELEQTAAKPSPFQTEGKAEMGHFKCILCTTLIVLAAVNIVFMPGFMTNHFVRYNPFIKIRFNNWFVRY